MPNEQEELVLVVRLDDQASEQFSRLQQVVGTAFTQTAQAGGKSVAELGSQVKGLQREIENLARGIPYLGSQLEGVGRKLGALTANLSPASRGLILLGSGVGALTAGFVALGNKLNEFARSQLALDAMSKTLGIMPAQLKVMQDQFKQVMTAGQADQMIRGFYKWAQEMGRVGSEARQQFINGAGASRDNAVTFINAITGATNRGDFVNAMNLAIDQARRAVAERSKQVGVFQATREQNALLSAMGLGPEALDVDLLRYATAEERKLYQQRIDMARDYAREWSKVETGTDEIVFGLETELLPYMTKFADLILKNGELWGKTIGDEINRTTKDFHDLYDSIKQVIDYFSDENKLKRIQENANPPGAPGGVEQPRGLDVLKHWGHGAWDFLHGHGAQTGGADAFAGSAGGPGSGAEIKDSTDQTKTNTKEVQGLTDRLRKWLDQGPLGHLPHFAEGGITGGPSVVGEAGAEAVTPLGGGTGGGIATSATIVGAGNQVVPLGAYEDAKRLSLQAGVKPEDVQAYFRSNGINLSVATCGQFMASIARAHGGQVPTGYEAASTWRTVGQPGYSDDPRAINFATWNRAKTGAGGSHVGAISAIRDDKGNITGYELTGANQGAYPQRNVVVTSTTTSGEFSVGAGPGQFSIRHEIPGEDNASPGPSFGSNFGKASDQFAGARQAAKAGRLARRAEGGLTTGPTLVGEHGPEVVLPLGNRAAHVAAGVRSYLERGGRSAVHSIGEAATGLWEQSEQSWQAVQREGLISKASAAEIGKTGLAGAGLVGSVLPTSIAAQVAIAPAAQSAGFSPETSSDIADVGGLLLNPTKGLGLIGRGYRAAQAGTHIAEHVGSSVLDQLRPGGDDSQINIEHRNAPPDVSVSTSGPAFANSQMRRQTKMPRGGRAPIAPVPRAYMDF